MFKVGDRVKCIKLGIGVVINVFDGDFVYVKFEGHNPLYYLKNGKAYGLADDFDITPIEKEKEKVKFNVGDKVRLKKEWYKEGDYQKMHRNDRQRIGKHHSFTMKVFDEGCAKYKENVHVYVDGGVICVPKVCLELVEEPKPLMHQWTQAEIDECNRIIGEIITSYFENGERIGIGTGEYLSKKIVTAEIENGKEYTSKPIPTDTPNLSIGMCVALCKATGREIPKFIKGDRK